MKFTTGSRLRWTVVGMLLLLPVFLAGRGEAISWDISGPWLIEGTGFVDWKGIRSSLELEGKMNVYTVESGDIWAITSYDVDLQLNATRADIGVWDDHLREVFHDHIPLLESLNPSLGKPFELPLVTKDGLTYRITFTSVTSGKVDISGEDAKLGSVGGLKLGSESALWRKGTSKPNVNDASSGCNSGGFGGAGLAIAALGLWPATRRERSNLVMLRVFRRFRVK
ncbi:MAG: hypothetical protein IJR68_00445 [Fretibacterium sp.]|nr:hypothetical protein [Fretibacterium sp.]